MHLTIGIMSCKTMSCKTSQMRRSAQSKHRTHVAPVLHVFTVNSLHIPL